MPATLVKLSFRRCIGTEEGHAYLIAHIAQGIGYSLQMTLHRSAQYLQAYLHHHGKRLEEKAERSIGMTEECCRTNTLISRLLRIINCQRVRIHHISIIRVKGIGSLATPLQQFQLVRYFIFRHLDLLMVRIRAVNIHHDIIPGQVGGKLISYVRLFAIRSQRKVGNQSVLLLLSLFILYIING